MFDEGVFVDINYRVDVSHCIFILTSNFYDEKSIAATVGLPIYSRIDKKIEFRDLSTSEIESIIKQTFSKVISTLKLQDRQLVEDSLLQDRYIEHLDTFSNVRMLDKFIENDIYELLMEHAMQQKWLYKLLLTAWPTTVWFRSIQKATLLQKGCLNSLEQIT